MTSLRVSLALLLSLLLSSAADARDWPEPGGGGWNNNATDDVEAPMDAPSALWRAQYDELLGDPVVSGGVVYVAARKKKSPRLCAIDVATGEEIESEKIRTSSFGHVSVRGTTVVVVTPTLVYVFERRGDSLKKFKTIRGTFEGPATLAPGVAAVTGEGRIRVLELRTGDELFRDLCARHKPAVSIREQSAHFHYIRPEVGEPIGRIARVAITGLGTREPKAGKRTIDPLFARAGAPAQAPEVIVLGGGSSPPLLVAFGQPVVTGVGVQRYAFFPDSKHAPAIDRDPVTWKGTLFGRSVKGALFFQAGRRDRTGSLLPERDRPRGAVDGPITRAKDVLLLGNYALDLDSARVLWCVPDLEFEGPLIPAADGVVIFRDGKDAIVAAGALTAGAEATAAASPVPAVDPTLPGKGDAVVLVDGTRFPGAVERLESGGARVTPKRGDAITLELADLCAVEVEGAIDVVGDPYGLVLAARDALERALAEDLAEAYEAYAGRSLVSEAQRVLQEVRDRGLPEEDVRKLEEKLAGKRESTAGNREKQLVAARRKEDRARDRALDRTIDACRTLTTAGLPLEASAVLATVDGIWEDELSEEAEESVLRVAKALVPGTFPWINGDSGSRRWLEWAREIAPAGGRFVSRAERPDVSEGDAIWTRSTYVLRTRNLLLVTRSPDPVINGACLRHGEAAIRTLDDVLENPPTEDDAPLEVRIHRTRRQYLEEDLGEGRKASEWSIGFYSPDLRVSRFHVPEDDELRDGRALHEVVAHELTHQYLNERWRALGERKLRSPLAHGFWVVEGFARYIEDQSLEMGRRGQRLDDPTVQSVDASSALAKKKRLLPMDSFIDAQQAAFLQLPEEPVAKVRLKSTLVTMTYSAKSVYYEQAGAMVFFLMNRCGEDGRKRFLDALRAHYRSEAKREGWKVLGFETAKTLEVAFLAFLRDPGAGG